MNRHIKLDVCLFVLALSSLLKVDGLGQSEGLSSENYYIYDYSPISTVWPSESQDGIWFLLRPEIVQVKVNKIEVDYRSNDSFSSYFMIPVNSDNSTVYLLFTPRSTYVTRRSGWDSMKIDKKIDFVTTSLVTPFPPSSFIIIPSYRNSKTQDYLKPEFTFIELYTYREGQINLTDSVRFSNEGHIVLAWSYLYSFIHRSATYLIGDLVVRYPQNSGHRYITFRPLIQLPHKEKNLRSMILDNLPFFQPNLEPVSFRVGYISLPGFEETAILAILKASSLSGPPFIQHMNSIESRFKQIRSNCSKGFGTISSLKDLLFGRFNRTCFRKTNFVNDKSKDDDSSHHLVDLSNRLNAYPFRWKTFDIQVNQPKRVPNQVGHLWMTAVAQPIKRYFVWTIMSTGIQRYSIDPVKLTVKPTGDLKPLTLKAPISTLFEPITGRVYFVNGTGEYWPAFLLNCDELTSCFQCSVLGHVYNCSWSSGGHCQPSKTNETASCLRVTNFMPKIISSGQTSTIITLQLNKTLDPFLQLSVFIGKAPCALLAIKGKTVTCRVTVLPFGEHIIKLYIRSKTMKPLRRIEIQTDSRLVVQWNGLTSSYHVPLRNGTPFQSINDPGIGLKQEKAKFTSLIIGGALVIICLVVFLTLVIHSAKRLYDPNLDSMSRTTSISGFNEANADIRRKIDIADNMLILRDQTTTRSDSPKNSQISSF